VAIKVLGAGFGRTGTNSLKMALEQLGFGPCYHMFEVRQEHVPLWYQAIDENKTDWEKILADFQSAVDWPVAAFIPELIKEYPDAKVILSERDPEKWFESATETIFAAMKLGAEKGIEPPGMAKKLVMDKVFEGNCEDRDHCVDIYNKHIENMIRVVPKEKLLRFKSSDGWQPLCDFLGVEVPEGEYPRSNDREMFQGLIKALRG